jgi:uracil-DNA glycosylase family 4
MALSAATPVAPDRDCGLCPRLVDFRAEKRSAEPDWHNAPVQSFGPSDARLLIVGLAPGLRGANRTGRPFTGDFAGDLLYATLKEFDLARGDYAAHAADGLTLNDCRITNAVRCVPPQNKPTGPEIKACRPFLVAEIAAMPRLRVMLALGSIAHNAVLQTLGLRLSAHRFGHGAEHDVGDGLRLIDSYHCSRLNTNTGRLTPAMFADVFSAIRAALQEEEDPSSPSRRGRARDGGVEQA